MNFSCFLFFSTTTSWCLCPWHFLPAGQKAPPCIKPLTVHGVELWLCQAHSTKSLQLCSHQAQKTLSSSCHPWPPNKSIGVLKWTCVAMCSPLVSRLWLCVCQRLANTYDGSCMISQTHLCPLVLGHTVLLLHVGSLAARQGTTCGAKPCTYFCP